MEPSSSDDLYGFPLGEALEKLSDPALTERIRTAWLAWEAANSPGNPRLANHAALLAGGRGDIRRPHPTIVELLAACKARDNALTRHLRSGGLEAFWCDDLIAGEWRLLRPETWEVLRIKRRFVDTTCVKSEPYVFWPRGAESPQRRRSTRIRLTQSQGAVHPTRPPVAGRPEELFRQCVDRLTGMAQASPDHPTHTQIEVIEELRKIWPEIRNKHYRAIRHEALANYGQWTRKGARKH